MAKNRRNFKVSQFGKDVVDLEEGLHILLQEDATKLFDIEAKVIRVCKRWAEHPCPGEGQGWEGDNILEKQTFHGGGSKVQS